MGSNSSQLSVAEYQALITGIPKYLAAACQDPSGTGRGRRRCLREAREGPQLAVARRARRDAREARCGHPRSRSPSSYGSATGTRRACGGSLRSGRGCRRGRSWAGDILLRELDVVVAPRIQDGVAERPASAVDAGRMGIWTPADTRSLARRKRGIRSDRQAASKPPVAAHDAR